jgi:cell division protein FtsW
MRRTDFLLLFVTVSLVLLGLVMVSSSTVVLGLTLRQDPAYYFRHQLFYGVLTGVLTWLVVQWIPYWWWRRLALPFLLVALGLLLLVFVPGFQFKYGGAARWLVVGPISIQPSEVAKFGFIIYLAAILSKHERAQRKEEHEISFTPFLVIVALMSLLLVMQPDIGTLFVMTATALTMFYAAGGRLRTILLLIAGSAAIFFLLIQMAPYRVARFTTFLHPELDPRGIGYQVHQALLAVGSGGLWGQGLGRSRQKFNFLPEPAGDSMFSIMAEELGFVRMIVVIGLYALLAFAGYRIARRAPDLFGSLLAAGITTWFVVQAFVHMAANLALLPLTGIPLPFISYGGTALVMTLAGAGVLLNISRYTLRQ